MITKCKNWEEWDKLYDEKGKDEVLGMSPGGVAGRLGVSRQRVFQLVQEGRLDEIKIWDDDQGFWVVYIPEVSVRKEIERRKKKT